jgi:predicted transcriptional regulator
VPRFGDLEEAIMGRVWAVDGPVRVRDVLEELQRERDIAYTTVQTVMEILRRKGWLERRKDGRAHRYWATASRAEYTARLMDEALSGTTDPAAALVRFVEQMEPSEVAQLRAALEQARDKSGDQPGQVAG